MTATKKTSRDFTTFRQPGCSDLAGNTLYPHHVNLWQQVDARIGEFVSAWLKISAEEAAGSRGLLPPLWHHMRGMMTEHGVHADDYLAYVHRIDPFAAAAEPCDGAAIANSPDAS